MQSESLAKTYAAQFILREDPLWVAEELFSIMEESIHIDSFSSQEITKEFLVDIIVVMQKIDKKYTDQVTKAYLELALQITNMEK